MPISAAFSTYLGKSDTFDNAVTEFAESYAARTITDPLVSHRRSHGRADTGAQRALTRSVR